MYFLALAADYDGTLADQGFVDPETIEALRAFKSGGRRLLLVTGRELDELKRVFPDLPLFDLVVAENGGLIYDPATGEERLLGAPPPAEFVRRLIERKVEPISVGRTIVAAWRPHEGTILQTIQELHLDLEIIFNKAAVMVLPAGVNKASGLRAALDELGMAPHNVVAVGDAENDRGFMAACGCSAAVANALPELSRDADIRLTGDHGAGVVELLKLIAERDLEILPPERTGVEIGLGRDGRPVYLLPNQTTLIVGSSGCGKSSFAKRLTELLVERRLEFCIIDPEGDYECLANALTIGDANTPPSIAKVIEFIRASGLNLVVNTIAMTLDDRRRLMRNLLPALTELRAASGRPHWLLIDEAHHFLPRGAAEPAEALFAGMPGTVLITVDPEYLPLAALRQIDVLLAGGQGATQAVAAVARANGRPSPAGPRLEAGEFLFWPVRGPGAARIVRSTPPAQGHKRHRGKYAAGDVGLQKGFRFGHAGPDAPCARNLADFVRLAGQASDEVWLRHLRAGDYAAWFRDVIRDDDLAQAAEARPLAALAAADSRKRIIEAVRCRYVLA